MTTEERITELEIRIAHLESTVQAMSDELLAQQRRGALLDDALTRLNERLESLGEGPDDTSDPLPPHY